MIKSMRALHLILYFVLVSSVSAQAQTDKTGDDKMSVKIELAPPGKPDSFTTYAEGEARRKGSV